MIYSEALQNYWNNKWWLSLSAGVLLGLSFPPFPFPFLMIPGIVLMLRVCDLAVSWKDLARVSFTGFLVWNLITTYWLMFATLPGGLLANLANAVLMTIPLAFMRAVQLGYRSVPLIALLQACCWVTFEFLHHRWDLAWPWITLGNGFSNAIPFIQYISVTGVLGISFWLVFSSSLIYQLARAGQNARLPSIRQVTGTAAAFFLPLIVSLIMFFTYRDEPHGFMELAVMQPNYDSYLHLGGYDDPYEPLDKLLAFTDSVVTGSTEFALWPENALIGTIELGYPSRMDYQILEYTGQWDIPLISGASLIRFYDDHENPGLYRGYYRGKPYNVFNAALAHYPDKRITHYEKARLVPFIERFPFVDFLSRFEWTGVDWGAIAIFGKGIERTMFEVNGRRIPALICYDSVYPDWVRKFVLDGADMITIITNDGWWGNTSGHIQHYDYARLRAIENRRTVIRSANNGLSGAIGPDGRIHIKTEYWTRDGFVYEAALYDRITFYARYGDLIGWLSLFGVIGLLAFQAAGAYAARRRQVNLSNEIF